MTKTWRSRETEFFHGYARQYKRDAVDDDRRRRERHLRETLNSRDLKRLGQIEEDDDDDEG